MSTIKVTNVQNPSAASAAITLDTNGQATLNGLAYPTSGSLSGRNRVINGSMTVDQRNAGASVSVTGNVYTLDRWNGGGSNDGTLSFQRVSDGPTGFANSLKITVSTADSSLAASQYARVLQKLEGYNVADLGGGTASPATVTLSFWIKSSVTGTYGGYVSNGDESQVYVFQYTVNTANTWEYKSVTVTLPTSGTWATDNTAGMRVGFSLGAGSSYVNTANTWLTSYAQQASGNVNLINTLNATFYITGVQLEQGSTATPFERRSYGQELSLCQRYYQKYTGFALRVYVGNVFRQMSALPVVLRVGPITTVTWGGATNLQLDSTTASESQIRWDIQYTGGGTGVVDLSGGSITLNSEL